jgi:hypothetical protein
MQTVIETQTFIKAAQKAGVTEAEVAAIVDFIAHNPEAGDAIQGSGGCRKVRVAGRGKGKSGGYRLIHFFSGPEIPVFLLTIYSKGSIANLTDSQRKELKNMTKELAQIYKS